MARNKARGDDPPGYECCLRRKNRASTVAGRLWSCRRTRKDFHRHRRRKREIKAKEQEASSVTSSHGTCTDRGTDIVVSAVIDAADRGLGTQGDGRQIPAKNKDFRGGGRSASGAFRHEKRIHAGSWNYREREGTHR